MTDFEIAFVVFWALALLILVPVMIAAYCTAKMGPFGMMPYLPQMPPPPEPPPPPAWTFPHEWHTQADRVVIGGVRESGPA